MTVDLPAPLGPIREINLALGNGEAHAVHHGFPVILFCQFLYMHGHTFFLVRRR